MTPTTFVTLPIQKHASSAWSQEGVKIKQKQKLKTFLEATCLTLWSSTWDALPKESKRRLLALNIFVLPQFHPRLDRNALFIFARERIKLHWFPFFFSQTPGHQGKELRVENVYNLGKGALLSRQLWVQDALLCMGQIFCNLFANCYCICIFQR